MGEGVWGTGKCDPKTCLFVFGFLVFLTLVSTATAARARACARAGVEAVAVVAAAVARLGRRARASEWGRARAVGSGAPKPCKWLLQPNRAGARSNRPPLSLRDSARWTQTL